MLDEVDMRSVLLITKGSGHYEQGEWISGHEGTPIELKMVVLPITPKQLKTLPEGVYTSEDKKFYLTGKPVLASDDILKFEDNQYKIGDISDRSFEGNYTIYYGKLLHD